MEFGVEKISDIIKTSELLSDEELRNELGMSDEAISLFRTLFLSEDEDDQDR